MKTKKRANVDIWEVSYDGKLYAVLDYLPTAGELEDGEKKIKATHERLGAKIHPSNKLSA